MGLFMSIMTTHSIKSEIKGNLSISLSLIASQLIYASSGFVSTIMVAHLGKQALAATVLVSMIWMSLSVLFFGVLNSISVLVSHQFGAKNYKAMSDIMGQAYLLGGIIFLTMLGIMLAVPYFLQFSHPAPEVASLASLYTFSLLWTLPALVILIVSEQFLAGIGQTKLVLRISLLVVPIEIPLIYMLIFGKFGLPACGVAGVGYGLAITYTATAIGLILYLRHAKHYRQYKIFSGISRIHFTYFKELLRVGLPMGFMHLIEVSSFALATFWIARFGTDMLAAHQIVIQFLSFSITIVFAMSQAITIRVGHAVGRQDLSGVRDAIYVGMIMNFLVILLIAIGFILFPEFFIHLDIHAENASNQLLIQYASSLLSICGALIIFDNFRIIGFGALRGLKDSQFPMLASFISFWLIGIPLAYLFGFVYHFAGNGIWWGLTLGILCGSIIIFFRIQTILKQVDLRKILDISTNKR